MSFFSIGGPHVPEPEEEREPYRRQPPLWGPSPDEVGRPAPASFVLAKSASAAVTVQAIRSYTTGCLFEISWVLRRTTETASQWRKARDDAFRHDPRDKDGDGLLLGVILNDGTNARTNDRYDWQNPGSGPSLVSTGSSGGGGGTERLHGTADHWLYPLPPAPTMDLICAWPRFGLDESRVTVGTTSILEAASNAHWIWPKDADLPLTQNYKRPVPQPRSTSQIPALETGHCCTSSTEVCGEARSDLLQSVAHDWTVDG